VDTIGGCFLDKGRNLRVKGSCPPRELLTCQNKSCLFPPGAEMPDYTFKYENNNNNNNNNNNKYIYIHIYLFTISINVIWGLGVKLFTLKVVFSSSSP